MIPQKPEAVVIGASAGAVDALSVLLPSLPANYPLPIFIVVHLPPDSPSVLAEIFAEKCRIQIKEAEDKEVIRPGVAYFAPPNYHLLVEGDGSLSLSDDEQELFSRPSINVLLESAADAYGSGLVAVILTGASHDGARGLRKVVDAGGAGFVQDPETAEARFLPQSSLAACPELRPMKLQAIAGELAGLGRAEALTKHAD